MVFLFPVTVATPSHIIAWGVIPGHTTNVVYLCGLLFMSVADPKEKGMGLDVPSLLPALAHLSSPLATEFGFSGNIVEVKKLGI